MKRIHLLLCLLLLTFAACQSRQDVATQPVLVSMQTIDRNGFSETISSKDRLQRFAQTDFSAPQPYQKVLRIYERDKKGISRSTITSYHSNGYLLQYLEIVQGRANGAYKEWHPNGMLKIDAHVIEGLGDVSETAQMSWVFEGKNSVWDDHGNLVAEFTYTKGMLDGTAQYYHPNGQISKSLPYVQNLLEGETLTFDENGLVLEKIPFNKGMKNGIAEGKDPRGKWGFYEEYDQGSLQKASYVYSLFPSLPGVINGEGYQAIFDNGRLSSLIEIHHGKPEGSVRFYHPNGSLKSLCHVIKGKKHGEEREFYSSSPTSDPLALPPMTKLLVFWHENILQGLTKTWYDNGVLESEREMNQNQMHGVSTAYYKDGTLMLMEEYQSGKLWKGTYFKRGDKQPVSRVEEGSGVATLYHGEGHFLRKTNYTKGKPDLLD